VSHRRRFWLELLVASAGSTAFVLTLLWKDWIELVFRVDVDARSGAAEWAIAAGLLALSICCGVLARAEWRRRPASAV